MELPDYKLSKKRDKCKIEIIKEYKIEDKYKSIGNGLYYFVLTYGCQMNERDSEIICGILEQMGFKKGKSVENSNLVLINTCAVRENAHNKVYGMLGRLKKLKEQKDILIGLCGCMAQEEVVVNEIINNKKYVDFVFGTHNINEVPYIISETIKCKRQIIKVLSNSNLIVEEMPSIRKETHKGFINISYGCDNFCTYCIVPYTRGRERSRLKEDILKEVIEMIEEGYKEITLLGQNVNSYGKELGYSFYDLLEEVSNTKIKRIKFVTSNPWDFDLKIIDLIKERKNILPFIHLPIQSGSNEILKLMGRKYNVEEYYKIIEHIKNNIDICNITTDIIVGFPNETDEDFGKTLEIVEKCKFDGAYTFIYSPRKGTPAALIKDNINLNIKKKRLSLLNERISKYALLNNNKMIGKETEVLVDRKLRDNIYMGYTYNNKLIEIISDEDCIGQIISVKIFSAKSLTLYGEKI